MLLDTYFPTFEVRVFPVIMCLCYRLGEWDEVLSSLKEKVYMILGIWHQKERED